MKRSKLYANSLIFRKLLTLIISVICILNLFSPVLADMGLGDDETSQTVASEESAADETAGQNGETSADETIPGETVAASTETGTQPGGIAQINAIAPSEGPSVNDEFIKDSLTYIKPAAGTIVIVISVEILFLFVFKLKIKKNLKYIILMSIITQLIFTIILMAVDHKAIDMALPVLILAGVQLLILFIKLMYYSDRLAAKEGGIKGKKNILYALTASAVSFILEMPFLTLFVDILHRV